MSNIVNGINFPNQINSEEVNLIRDKFLLRDRSNIDNSSAIKADKSTPVVIFDRLSTPDSLSNTVLSGLSYPLELDEYGGLKLSNGMDRIGQAIQEVFETRIGERVGNPFMGIRELMFETISEEVEAQNIKRQLLSSIPYLREQDLSVSLSLGEDGTCYIVAKYAVEGVSNILVRYNFTP